MLNRESMDDYGKEGHLRDTLSAKLIMGYKLLLSGREMKLSINYGS